MATLARAVSAIEEHGVLLVYPIQNRPEPLSLWHVLHPRTKMRWSWDAGADDRVVELWHLREKLARSKKVVYAKWLAGRATFFSKAAFRALLATFRDEGDLRAGLSPDSRNLLELLYDDSPQPTRALRERAGLEGRANETRYARAMKPLWERMLAVGAGEVEEGGFPSLAIGATELLHESLFLASERCTAKDREVVEALFDRHPSVKRASARILRGLVPREEGEPLSAFT